MIVERKKTIALSSGIFNVFGPDTCDSYNIRAMGKGRNVPVKICVLLDMVKYRHGIECEVNLEIHLLAPTQSTKKVHVPNTQSKNPTDK